MVLTVRTTDTPWYKNKSRASHTPDLFLHEAELLGDVLLVLAVVVLGQSKQAVAQPEHVLEGGVARARQVLYAQQGGLALHLRGGAVFGDRGHTSLQMCRHGTLLYLLIKILFLR